MMRLYEALEKYKKEDVYPFHMPGHKRRVQKDQYAIDITEIEGFDNLHAATGIIYDEMNRLAEVYGADKAYLLVNGSTCGNLAAVYAVVGEKDKILIDRNCHKSLYNAVIIKGCRVEYIYSGQVNGIARCPSLSDIKKIIENDDEIKAVALTSPTYEGYTCDIRAIAKYLHEKDIILIVDSAHGAHLGFNDYFPPNPINEGADIVVVSLHKTLPSLTQTAALLVKSQLVDNKRIENALSMFETSSPSYVLMSSISECIEFLENAKKESNIQVSNGQDNLFKAYEKRLKSFYKFSEGLEKLLIRDQADIYCETGRRDPSKILIDTRNTDITGNELASILRKEYRIESEYSLEDYCLLMTSVMDTEEGMERLKKALLGIDKRVQKSRDSVEEADIEESSKSKPKVVMSMREAREAAFEYVEIFESLNRISNDFIMVYPPGVPMLAPGEEINAGVIDFITTCIETKQNILGLKDNKIAVVRGK